MKTLLRTLLFWTVLLALPFQGLAAALPCAPVQHSGAHHAPHGEHTSHGSGGALKCAGGGTCCTGAAMLPALPAAPAGAAVQGAPVAVPVHHLSSVDLAHPERPPRSRRA